jgi:hypothetical protein
VHRLDLDEASTGLLIKGELEMVSEEVKKKVEKLRSASDVHIGTIMIFLQPSVDSRLMTG